MSWPFLRLYKNHQRSLVRDVVLFFLLHSRRYDIDDFPTAREISDFLEKKYGLQNRAYL